MDIKKAKAAILAQSRAPLIIDDIELPKALDVGQVLIKILYTTICGAQLNEIAATKGPDRFLPHLLGHEASGTVVETGPGVANVKPNDTVVLHWRPSLGIQCAPPSYSWRGEKLNAGWVTTFNEYAVISENRMTPIPIDYNLKVAPLLGCAVTTAAGVINNDAKLRIGTPLQSSASAALASMSCSLRISRAPTRLSRSISLNRSLKWQRHGVRHTR